MGLGDIWNKFKGGINPYTGLWGGFEALFEDSPQQLPTRPPLGASSEMAAREQARAYQSILGQQFQSQIVPMINREFGQAGRFASGQRLGAIQEAGTNMQGILGNLVRQDAMQRYVADLQGTLGFEQLDQDWYWKQAQLDQQGQIDYSQIGQLLPYLL